MFVGLTAGDAEEAESFVAENGIAWPNGYGAEKTIETLVGAAPTIFVVGRSGQIVWNDDRSRFRHDVEDLLQQLEAAIELALNEP